MGKKDKNENAKNKKDASKIGKMDSGFNNQTVKRAYYGVKMYTNVHAACLFTFKIGTPNTLIHNAPVHFAHFAYLFFNIIYKA